MKGAMQRDFGFVPKLPYVSPYYVSLHRGAIHIRVSGYASFRPIFATISLRGKSNTASSARVRMTTRPKSVKRIASLMSMTLEM
jgi:hypothetical protein